MQAALKRTNTDGSFAARSFERRGAIPGAADIRILLLEDEAVIALDMRNDLVSWGFTTVAIAHNEAQARQKLERDRPNLVIVDVALQETEDGIEIINRLKKEFSFSIIFLTAHSDWKTRQRIIESQSLGYMFKPYSSYALYDFLADLSWSTHG